MPSMQTTTSTFVHGNSKNGTMYSMCKRCLTLVVRAQWEADLEVADRNHVCDSDRLEYVRRLNQKNSEDV
jgi:hypothetical protein